MYGNDAVIRRSVARMLLDVLLVARRLQVGRIQRKHFRHGGSAGIGAGRPSPAAPVRNIQQIRVEGTVRIDQRWIDRKMALLLLLLLLLLDGFEALGRNIS